MEICFEDSRRLGSDDEESIDSNNPNDDNSSLEAVYALNTETQSSASADN